MLELPDLPEETDVWVKSEGEVAQGRVVSPAGTPRSYMVDVPSGRLQRNRRHLSAVPPPSQEDGTLPLEIPDPPPKRIMTRSQTGTSTFPPDRLA